MSNPYYIGSAGYNPNLYMPPVTPNNSIPTYQTPAPAPAPNYNFNNYNFVGKYVKSYDEVRNAPFEDKTCIYLDVDHDRIYIKEITQDGIPKINVLGLTDIQNNSAQRAEVVEETKESFNSTEFEAKFDKALNDFTNKFEKRLKILEDKANIQKNF